MGGAVLEGWARHGWHAGPSTGPAMRCRHTGSAGGRRADRVAIAQGGSPPTDLLVCREGKAAKVQDALLALLGLRGAGARAGGRLEGSHAQHRMRRAQLEGSGGSGGAGTVKGAIHLLYFFPVSAFLFDLVRGKAEGAGLTVPLRRKSTRCSPSSSSSRPVSLPILKATLGMSRSLEPLPCGSGGGGVGGGVLGGEPGAG